MDDRQINATQWMMDELMDDAQLTLGSSTVGLFKWMMLN